MARPRDKVTIVSAAQPFQTLAQRSGDIAYPPRTSLPVWPVDIPQLDPNASSFTLFFLGHSGSRVCALWKQMLIEQRIPFDVVLVARDQIEDWVQHIGSSFPALAATQFVGWRIALAGEEFAVLAVRAAAISIGMLEVETVSYVESSDRAFIYCPYCKHKTLIVRSQKTSDRFACDCCARLLTVHLHLSRAHGSYLASVRSDETGGTRAPVGEDSSDV